MPVTSCAGYGFVYEDLSLEAVPGALRGFARSYREAFGALDREELARLADLLRRLKSHIRKAEESTT